ncbi:MAG TPA: PhzF family phenazine biosynthesis protein [Gallionellaceae bacterium]|nr:PhzF family phenazine biosynthesis protein [Gallionellaceae bacterium]
MRLIQYQVDAFTNRLFAGNPAAVVPLQHWLDDTLMQAIAAENNLSETAFFVPQGDAFELRWFTPMREVDLCGHATLASAHVLFEHLDHTGPEITFTTRSGALIVRKQGNKLVMDFPVAQLRRCEPPAALLQGLGAQPLEVWAGDDYLAVFDSEAAILALQPNHAQLSRLDRRGVIATAPGVQADFVSRFFAPRYGIAEDPVTGSAHCMLTPYWAARLGKNSFQARQVSQRGGEIECTLMGERVLLAGQAITFMQAELDIAT